MTNHIAAPRKRRTRQHVFADLAVHHVEGFILKEGHTCQRLHADYGYDLIVWTFDEQGYAEHGAFYLQLKAMERLEESGTYYLFDLDIRDYNLWVREKFPIFLVLFDAGRERAFWLAVQQYFKADPARQPKQGAKTIRVRVPKKQVVSRRAIAKMRELKSSTPSQQLRGIS